tara:strand:- start:59 stop:358 length:300 start_codon:yes stop_codon:yes gene_type:complete
MNVKLIRMWSGEDVVADLVKETDDSVTIANPIVAVPSQQQGHLAFAPWSPILKERNTEVDVTKRYVVYITETQDDVVDQYKEMFGNSAVATPPKKRLIL